MDYIALGQRVRRYRRAKHLTIEQLAELVDMSASFLGHVERGSRKASIETVMHLCQVLDVTPNELLEGTMPVRGSSLPERITISPAALLESMAELLHGQEIPQ